MASEILIIPEDYLDEVVSIIRCGLADTPRVRRIVRKNLTSWCDKMDEYLKQLKSDE